ncbi:SRPBCC family protein [Devosia sp. RR2S18]|uniref:SRPBCC family protein n=1 Tax=Devosia rhizosphaerae TaxID=3049774 RepID=UPI00253F793A|nr:SRPBCC domain-containing protein [Devosia sp. RR2S18]WIJ25707.1 SRPBCC domain-containing protein [Devosia sp. RR2S18]
MAQYTSTLPRQVLVEATIAAPIDEVWRAVREPERIATWFGWEASTLEEEIAFIFLDHAAADEATHTIRFEEWQGIADGFELTEEDTTTRLEILRYNAPPVDIETSYDGMVEGWISFTEQLRFALEQHPSEARRTIYLAGAAKPASPPPSVALGLAEVADSAEGSIFEAVLDTGDMLNGAVRRRTRYQTILEVGEWGRGMLVVTDMDVTEKRRHGGGSLLLTTYGMVDSEFADLERRWSEWWTSRYSSDQA